MVLAHLTNPLLGNRINSMQTASPELELDPLSLPDARGHFGAYGGMYVPETLMTPLFELTEAYHEARKDPAFQKELDHQLREFAGRPTNLYFADRLTEHCGGAKIYLKREDLLHTGAHKINNAVGQALLAKRMGKKRIIAETGAGQHGIATAAMCAKMGFECVIYMGEEDMRRQSLNVYRMRLCGAEVRSVTAGQRTLKEAVNEAMRDWVTNVSNTHYIIGSALGSHPFPMMVRDFHRVIGEECRRQILEKEGRLPDEVTACVGGGSNAIGMFHPFLEDKDVRLIGVEAGGSGLESGRHAAPLSAGTPGILHGNRTYLMSDENGQILPTHSVSAGLDYPGVGPEHSYLKDTGRAEYVIATDTEALDSFRELCLLEGIIPALESSHAVAYACKMASQMRPDQTIVVNLSGRGDKDMQTVADIDGIEV